MMAISRILLISSAAYLAMSIGIKNIAIDKEFVPYYNDYMSQVKAECNSSQYVTPRQLYIGFDDLDYPIIGKCGYNYFGKHVIVFDKRFWNRQSIVDRKQLFAHEFVGHCTFHQNHSPDPHNFMYASFLHLNEEELTKQVTQYIKDRCAK
jgi:hypothetical protein